MKNSVKKNQKPKITLLIYNEQHELDCNLLGIHEDDYSELFRKLAELRDDLDNECTLAYAAGIMYNILSNTQIEYRTAKAFDQGRNTILVSDTEYFIKLCDFHYNKTIESAWLSVLYEISDDISTLEERYGEMRNGKFLRSLLVYFSNFIVTDHLR